MTFVPVMAQKWHKLLFMHWRVPEEAVRPLIPGRLTIDTHDGSAYVALVPFTMTGIRPVLAPPLPWLSSFHELNVRTYVHLDGQDPGVWFFSLDAARLLAVWGARASYFLPYFHARMQLETIDGSIRYSSQRLGGDNRGRGYFRGVYTPGASLPLAQPGSLPYFLTERYCLYTKGPFGGLLRARISHPQWQLQEATIADFASDLIEVAGLPAPSGPPLLHYSEIQEVKVGLPERCG